MPKEAARVAETATTTGTGAITLAGALGGHQTFGTAYGTGGNTDVGYGIVMDSGQWEVGLGTFLGGTNQLQRDTVIMGSAGASKVNFPVGSKTIYISRLPDQTIVARSRRATDVAVELRAASGQTADLMQVYNAAGSEVLDITAAGVLEGLMGALFGGNIRVGADAGNLMGAVCGALFIYASAGNNVGFKTDGPSGSNVAVIIPGGTSTTAGGAITVLTREKGDARYASISSLRYKDDVVLAGRIPGFLDIDPSTWVWGGSLAEDDFRRGMPGYGLVVEDLFAVSPSLVGLNDDGLPDTLNVGALIGALQAEVKHLSGLVASLTARLDAL